MKIRLNRSKGLKWKKHGASSSNPTTKKHRDNVKNQLLGHGQNSTDHLTKGALDELIESNLFDSDATSQSTFHSWATRWTDCTNVTFNKLYRYWNMNSSLYKETLAVLAAVTEVIRDKTGQESELEYFAAFMTTLQTVESEESLSAVLYLISMVIRRINKNILQAKFSEIANAFSTILQQYISSSQTTLLRSALFSLSWVCKLQDRYVWNEISNQTFFNTLLIYIIHPNAKVRKACHKAVSIVLCASDICLTSDDPHPMAVITGKYCLQTIEEKGGIGDLQNTLYVLNLLKSIISVLPKTSVKSICECLLRLMTLKNVSISSTCMNVFHNLFSDCPKKTTITPDMNSQIIAALFEYQPGENDQQQIVLWLSVIEQAYIHLNRFDQNLTLSHLPKLFTICMNCLLSSHKQVYVASTNVLMSMMKLVLKPQCELIHDEYKRLGSNSLLSKLFVIIEQGLTYSYSSVWNFVLHLLKDMFDIIGKEQFNLCKNCLASLAGLRSTDDFSFMSELDATVGRSIRIFGPKLILDVIPLNLTGTDADTKLEQSWLLPLLRDNIVRTELSHFVNYFLPFAFKLKASAEALKVKGDNTKSTLLNTLQDQIWSLFPAYCNHATDILISLKAIAKGIGTSLTNRPDIRLYLLAGLRNLISKCDNENDQIEVGKYAKNYLPLLFNIYTSEKWKLSRDPVRQSLFETLKRYLTITNQTLCQTFFQRCMEKYNGNDIEQSTLTYLLDIIFVLVPYIDTEQLQLLEEKLKQILITSQNDQKQHRGIIKKCYRILEQLCSRKTDILKQFINEKRSQFLLEHLLASLPKSKSVWKGSQIRCITSLMEMEANQTVSNIQTIMPQVKQSSDRHAVLCLQEMNGKTRHCAYLLVIQCGKLWIKISENNFIESLTEFFHITMSGLTSNSTSMISSTLLALGRLCLEFKENLAGTIVDELMSTLILVLQSRQREIVQAALSFCRVTLIIFSEVILSQYIKELAKAFSVMKDTNEMNFRSKMKSIIQKLLKIFGYDLLIELFSNSYHSQMTYIHKMKIRSERKKSEVNDKQSQKSQQTAYSETIADEMNNDNESNFTVKPKMTIDDLLQDSDSDFDDDNENTKSMRSTATKASRRHKQSSLWIKETNEEPLDLNEPSAARQIYATKPLTKKEQASVKKDKRDTFRTAPDGRIIIIDDEQDKKSKNKNDDEDEEEKNDDIKDLMETLSLSQRLKSKKRKRGLDDDDYLDDNKEDTKSKQSQSRYKAGGSGIHRPLNRKKIPGENYKAKKGSGDVKLANKHDPYAYIKLDFNALNKRKRSQYKGQFENIVGAAKRGAKRGTKLGKKERKLKRLKS